MRRRKQGATNPEGAAPSELLRCADRHRQLLVDQLIEEWESSGQSVSAGVICSLNQLVAVDALVQDLRRVGL